LDNYIVRIYRRNKGDQRLLVGLVEEVGSGGKRAFNTFDDLWDILNPGTRCPLSGDEAKLTAGDGVRPRMRAKPGKGL
jgi:hypothetical protein